MVSCRLLLARISVPSVDVARTGRSARAVHSKWQEMLHQQPSSLCSSPKPEAMRSGTRQLREQIGLPIAIVHQDRQEHIAQLVALVEHALHNGSMTCAKHDIEKIYDQIQAAVVNCVREPQVDSQHRHFAPMSQHDLMKECKAQKEKLIGRRVCIFWSGEKKWYSAVITRIDLAGKFAKGPAVEVRNFTRRYIARGVQTYTGNRTGAV